MNFQQDVFDSFCHKVIPQSSLASLFAIDSLSRTIVCPNGFPFTKLPPAMPAQKRFSFMIAIFLPAIFGTAFTQPYPFQDPNLPTNGFHGRASRLCNLQRIVDDTMHVARNK